MNSSPIQALLGSIIRHFLSAFGIWLVHKGWTDASTAAGIQSYALPLAGAIITGTVLGYSYLRTLNFKKAFNGMKSNFDTYLAHVDSGKIQIPNNPPFTGSNPSYIPNELCKVTSSVQVINNPTNPKV